MTHDPYPTHRALAPRDVLTAGDLKQLWRVASGALRIDSAPVGEPSRFVRLALPGDIVGIEQWAGTGDRLSLRALVASHLTPVTASGEPMMQLLMETVVQAHQRCREMVGLRTGPVAQRIKALLLMFAPEQGQGRGIADCDLPNLADLSDIVDAAPETVSRVFASMRTLQVVQDRKPQRASFSSEALRRLEIVAGMTSPRAVHKMPCAGT